MSDMTIANRAMIARYTAGYFQGIKNARHLADETAAAHNSDARMHRHRQLLLPKEAISPLQSIATAARLFHYTMTLPWQDDGSRVLTSKSYMTYLSRMRVYQDDFNTATATFITNYNEYIADAKERLKGLFNSKDYPTAAEIKNKFYFEFYFSPIPTAGDFRVSLGNDELKAEEDRIRADIESRAKSWETEASKELFNRIFERVQHMVERLKLYHIGDDGKAKNFFHASLVGNIKDLAELLPLLNVTDDPLLTKMAERLDLELCEYTPEELREDELIRETVAGRAEKILSDVSALI